jgi:catechol 2,3-dioxygenase-like lactoylglutathione lyase family enzyme
MGLLAKDPKATKKCYHDILGLRIDHEENGLSVFDGGWPGLEIGACSDYPDRVHLSSIVDDVDKLAEEFRVKKIKFGGPGEIHLGKRAIVLMDADGLRVLIQSPTEASPGWLKKTVE